MDPIPADQKLITEHPELVDPISGVIPPPPPAAPPAPAEPATDSTRPMEEEADASQAQEAAPARHHLRPRPRQAAHDRHERVRAAMPRAGAKRTGRTPKRR